MTTIKKYLKQNHVMWQPQLSDKYHPCLTSGKHSNLYINCTKILESYNLTTMLLREIDGKVLEDIVNQGLGAMCGLQTGGVGVLYMLPSLFPFLTTVKLIHTDKNAGHKITRWDVETISKPIMLVDDVITTGSSIAKVLSNHSVDIFSDYIVCLVNRTGSDTIKIHNKTFGIISALTISGSEWLDKECPYCKAGSEPIKPKLLWDTLN